MVIERNLQLTSSNGRAFLLDLYYHADKNPKPVVVFAHGFKGFKDWGHWHLIARAFAEAGFVFLKFNFSHNGTTIDAPLQFADLDAFGRNNYSKELADLDTVLNWMYTAMEGPPRREMNLRHLCLIGHSRGGGVSIVKANLDDRITSLITWASVSALDYSWQNIAELEKWKEKGVMYIRNARTQQDMPIFIQLYNDFLKNKELFDLQRAASQLRKPFLIIHGTADTSVPASAAQQLHRWADNSELHLIQQADHVFGGKHPYHSESLPEHSKMLIQKSIGWLKS